MDLFHWELLLALAGWLRGVGGAVLPAGRGRATRLRFVHFLRARAGLAWLDDLGRGVLQNILPALGLDGLLRDLDTGQNLRQSLARVELIEQGVPDHDAVHTHAFQLLDLLEGADARLEDPQAPALGDLLQQRQRLFPEGLPGVQVAAQHAHDVGVGVQRPLEIGLAGHLHDHVQGLGPRQLLQRGQTIGLQQRGHEEDPVRAQDLALLDLVLLEDEVVAQQRDLHRGADIGEVLVLAEEQEPVGRHGDHPGAVLHQALGVGGGPVGLADLAAQRVAARRLGDDGDARQAQFFLQRVVSLVGVFNGCRTFLLLDLDVQCLEYLDFFQHL